MARRLYARNVDFPRVVEWDDVRALHRYFKPPEENGYAIRAPGLPGRYRRFFALAFALGFDFFRVFLVFVTSSAARV
jgi:hypothetical protein